MGNERLLQILDNSACLTSRQLDGYLKHTLFPEELRVVEMHLNGCPFCSDALDGLEQQQHQLATLLGTLSLPPLPDTQLPEKVKEKKEPEAGISTKTAYRHYPTARTGTTPAFNKWKMPAGIAAALLIGFGALWVFKFRNNNTEILAVNTETTSDGTPGLNSEQVMALKERDTSPVASRVREAKKTADTIAALANNEQAPVPKRADSVAPSLAVATTAMAKDQASELRDTEKSEVAQVQHPAATIESKEKATMEKARTQAAAAREEENELPAVRSNYRIGLEQYQQKEYEKALGYFKQPASDPADANHWNAVYYTGMSYKALGKKRKAIRQFKQIIDSDNQSRKAAAQKQLDELK